MEGAAAGSIVLNILPANKHDKGGSNALMQEDVMAEVLQHFNTRERLHLATVSRHWRACVAKSWTTANLSGRDLGKELTWLAHCVPPRMLKELVVRGGSMPSNMQIHLALSIQPFSTLRSLTLEPERGITLASVATLSSLHQLTSLATNLNHLTSLAPSLAASLNAQNPVDLAEYAHLTGLQRLHILMTNGHQDAGVLLSRKWGALENLTDLELSGWNQLRQEGGASAGALHFLFQHLKRAAFKAGGRAEAHMGRAELELASPTLESLSLMFQEVVPYDCPSTSPALPNLLALTYACKNDLNTVFKELPALESLRIEEYLGPAFRLNPATITALACHSPLRCLNVDTYVAPNDTSTFEELALLPLLEDVTLGTLCHFLRSYSISERLSDLHHLKNVVLYVWDAKYEGGIEHLPALQMLTIYGTGDGGAALESTSLTRLTISGHGQQSSLPLGHLPNVTSFVRRHVLELTPAVLRDILSLRALQELTVSVGYKADMRGRGPANGDDVTTLLQNLPALPPLRAAQIKAIHTSVGPVDMACLADLEHSALGCEELTLRTGGWHPAVGKLKSLHVVVSKPSPETVGILQRVKARQTIFAVGTSKSPLVNRLQHWKAGLPHALDVQLPSGGRKVEAVIPELWFDTWSTFMSDYQYV